MKKKLLMLLMAGFSFAFLPSCGDEDDDEPQKNEQTGGDENGEKQPSFKLSDVPGTYTGVLSAMGQPYAEDLGVTVTVAGDNKINLALEPIVIEGMEIKDLKFPNIDCKYDEASKTWDFSVVGLNVSLMDGAVQAVVDVNEGKFSEDGKLNFSILVDAGVIQLPMNYSGKK